MVYQKQSQQKQTPVWAPCPVGSSLVVTVSHAGFGLAIILSRQMLPTGQVPTPHHCLICSNRFGNYTKIAYKFSISPRCAGICILSHCRFPPDNKSQLSADLALKYFVKH